MSLFVVDSSSSAPRLAFVQAAVRHVLPVVFLHSAGGNTSQWQPQIEHVRRSRRAIAVDLPGHGRSGDVPCGERSVEAIADDVQRALSRLHLGRFVLVGHSFGGAVSIALAAADPSHVAGLLLLAPSTDLRQAAQRLGAKLMKRLHSGAYSSTMEALIEPLLVGATLAVRERILLELRATPRQTMIDVLNALFRFDPVSTLARYPGPRLCVVTDDTDVPDGLHRVAPELPIQRRAGVGHWLQLDDPDGTNALLDAFLDTVDSAERARGERGA